MKYLFLASNFIQSNLIHKARIFIWSITDVINFIIFPFVWLAIFASRDQVGGFSRADIVSYYIIMALISFAFSSHISPGIRQYIIEGKLNQYLIQPISYIFYTITREMSYRIITFVLAIPLIIILKIFFSNYLLMPVSWSNFFFFVFSLLMSLALSTAIQFIIGFAVFWMGDTGTLQGLHKLLKNVFSGRLAPIAFYPVWLAHITDWTPFKYMYYFPFQVYTGKLNLGQVLYGFGIELVWLVSLSAIVFILFRRGLRIYDGAGI